MIKDVYFYDWDYEVMEGAEYNVGTYYTIGHGEDRIDLKYAGYAVDQIGTTYLVFERGVPLFVLTLPFFFHDLHTRFGKIFLQPMYESNDFKTFDRIEKYALNQR